jgi:hypothetical protein
MSFKKDRKKPCKECPFRRENNLDGPDPGGSHPFVYVGQSEGPFWLPCHMEKEYEGKATDPAKVNQCAGAAIYRANIGVAEKMPEQILALDADKELVFASHAEFIAHYLKATVKEAEEFIESNPGFVQTLLRKEMSDMNIKIHKLH